MFQTCFVYIFRNKSLMFGWMSVDRGIHWYSQLLSMALKNIDDEEGLEPVIDVKNVKPKNCVGTVLSLNGHRKYFCIYHARHPESLSSNGGQVKYGKITFKCNIASFVSCRGCNAWLAA